MEITNKNKFKHRTSLARKVNQYDLNGNFIKQWDNLLQIAHSLNKTTTVLFHCCEKDAHFYTAYGYQWRYADDCNDIKPYITNRLIYEIDKQNKILYVFNNISEIKQKYNNQKLWISDTLTHKTKSTHGHIFIYADEYKEKVNG